MRAGSKEGAARGLPTTVAASKVPHAALHASVRPKFLGLGFRKPHAYGMQASSQQTEHCQTVSISCTAMGLKTHTGGPDQAEQHQEVVRIASLNCTLHPHARQSVREQHHSGTAWHRLGSACT